MRRGTSRNCRNARAHDDHRRRRVRLRARGACTRKRSTSDCNSAASISRKPCGKSWLGQDRAQATRTMRFSCGPRRLSRVEREKCGRNDATLSAKGHKNTAAMRSPRCIVAVADRGRFELPIQGIPVYSISNAAPSTARTPVQRGRSVATDGVGVVYLLRMRIGVSRIGRFHEGNPKQRGFMRTFGTYSHAETPHGADGVQSNHESGR